MNPKDDAGYRIKQTASCLARSQDLLERLRESEQATRAIISENKQICSLNVEIEHATGTGEFWKALLDRVQKR